MERLFTSSRKLVQNIKTHYVRDMHNDINWNSRLVAILGSRGTGKTTMMLQHIQLYEDLNETLYVTADDFYFTTHRLEELAEKFVLYGGKHLYIDEIHKYKGWTTEIKNIYDKYTDLKVVYSGSSILELEKGGADLSRRKIEYHLPGLSFREYINIKENLHLPKYTLEDILAGKVDFPYQTLKPLQLFEEYIREGYYPFFIEGDYSMRLTGVIKQIVEEDVPNFADFDVASVHKLKKFLYVLAQSVPFKPNYSKLERDLGISRNTLPQYLLYLEKTGLISLLREKAKGIKLLEKVEKVYLQNPNLSYVLSETTPDIGHIRETIFFAWIKVNHFISSSKVSDFEIDENTFEIGGKNKTRKQLSSIDAEKAYVVKDGIEYSFQHTIPLWMFGFIY